MASDRIPYEMFLNNLRNALENFLLIFKTGEAKGETGL